MDDTIYRQAAIDAVRKCSVKEVTPAYMLINKAEVMTELMMLPSAQPEQPPEIQDILNYLDTVLHPIISPEHWDVYSELHDMISSLPSAELEQEHTMEEFMYGQELGNPEDGSL